MVFIGFEIVVDGRSVTHCLSEFEYREEEFNMFFNSVEVEAVSDQGEFCAIKTGMDVNNFSNYSRCTIDYTLGEFVLFYGFKDCITGKNHTVQERVCCA